MTGFENFGKQRNVEDDAKMECGVCWHVYDPARRRSRLANPGGHALLRTCPRIGAAPIATPRRRVS